MIISIDFDGTVCRDAYPLIGVMQPYARQVINRLYDRGYYIIINTCREGDMLRDAINWLLDKGIKFNRVNDNYPPGTNEYGYNSRKVYAHVYIDDRNLGGFPGWKDVYDQIEQLPG